MLMPLPLPEMTLRAAGAVPPTVAVFAERFTPTPFEMATVPVTSVPMKLP